LDLQLLEAARVVTVSKLVPQEVLVVVVPTQTPQAELVHLVKDLLVEELTLLLLVQAVVVQPNQETHVVLAMVVTVFHQ
jgi:hypothetical protein